MTRERWSKMQGRVLNPPLHFSGTQAAAPLNHLNLEAGILGRLTAAVQVDRRIASRS